jgi:rRNA maturation endonuclease Nob1
VDIKQATSSEENGCTADDRKMYVIRCSGCNKEWAYKYARMPKFYSKYQNYHCMKCGGNIERVGVFTQAEYKKRMGKELTAV